MKDALTCDKLRGAGMKLRSGDFRMGKPYQANLDNFYVKRIEEQTLGSETSQYQEEKRTIVIPLVAASEKGGAQTQPHK